jgi:hypothetical protein
MNLQRSTSKNRIAETVAGRMHSLRVAVGLTPSTDAAANRPPDPTDDVVLGGWDAATATSAALRAVPGGMVMTIETDADGAVYAVHMTRADGMPVMVTFDEYLAVVAVEEGVGVGPAGPPWTGAPRTEFPRPDAGAAT